MTCRARVCGRGQHLLRSLPVMPRQTHLPTAIAAMLSCALAAAAPAQAQEDAASMAHRLRMLEERAARADVMVEQLEDRVSELQTKLTHYEQQDQDAALQYELLQQQIQQEL